MKLAKCKRNIFKNKEECLDSLAEAFIALATEILRTREQCRVVLGGGRTPVILIAIIVQICKETNYYFKDLQVYLSDERIVPVSYPDNTATMLSNILITPLKLPETQLHRTPTSMDSTLAAEFYHQEISQLRGQPPLFHLVLLGLGRDGHTASLFPKSLALKTKNKLAVAAGQGPEGAERVSLTCEALQGSELFSLWPLEKISNQQLIS